MKNINKLKELTSTDIAYLVCIIDNVGDCRGCCAICQRHKENNCDDRCVTGVYDWLESEANDD